MGDKRTKQTTLGNISTKPSVGKKKTPQIPSLAGSRDDILLASTASTTMTWYPRAYVALLLTSPQPLKG